LFFNHTLLLAQKPCCNPNQKENRQRKKNPLHWASFMASTKPGSTDWSKAFFPLSWTETARIMEGLCSRRERNQSLKSREQAIAVSGTEQDLVIEQTDKEPARERAPGFPPSRE
jgi:hypothetical protein